MSAGVSGLKELAQSLLANVKSLCGRGVGHACHRPPEVEGVGDVSTDRGEDKEDEVDRVAEDCSLLVSGRCCEGKGMCSPVTISFHPRARSRP